MPKRTATLLLALSTALTTQALPASQASAASCSPTTYQRGFNLPAASLDVSAIDALSASLIAPEEPVQSSPDPEENRNVAAAWTYFGQFVDHDITLDAASDDLTSPRDPSSVTNSRTQWLDLDNVYGTSPSVTPSLYQADGAHLLEGSQVSGGTNGFRDLPRTATGRAILGDARDDENRMVAGIHASFISLHNRYVDRFWLEAPSLSSSEVFLRARAATLADYKSILVSEYLPRISDPFVYSSYVSPSESGTTLRPKNFFDVCMGMPVEFSVAAYRFGHSQVRAFYRLNSSSTPLPVFDATFNPTKMVGGFSPLAEGSGIDWSLFINTPDTDNSSVQWSYRIDPSITHSLSLLPLPATGLGPANLARRNLLRSSQLSLPSGENVARTLGFTPLQSSELLTGAASDTSRAPLASLDASLESNTPLWAYVLAESSHYSAGRHLGPVGSSIVLETFSQLLSKDPSLPLTSLAPRRAHLRDVLFSTPLPAPKPAPRPAPTPKPAPRPAPTPKPAPRPGARPAPSPRVSPALSPNPPSLTKSSTTKSSTTKSSTTKPSSTKPSSIKPSIKNGPTRVTTSSKHPSSVVSSASRTRTSRTSP